ncbi:MAG: hypothetical protein IJF18_02765 [Oscillospiraceae bacterium]|nr:hypothetical protein [Oscillospiraceae bacterium]
MKRFSAFFFALVFAVVMTACSSNNTDESSADLHMIDKESMLGVWYAMYDRGDICSYNFKEDGTLLVKPVYDEPGSESFTGNYSVENGKVTWNLKCDTSEFISDVHHGFCGVIDGDVLVLRSSPISHDPYEIGQSVSEFLCNPGVTTENMYMSRNIPVLVNQEDVLGAWVCNRNYDDEVGLYIFEEDNTTKVLSGEIITANEVLKNGEFVPIYNSPQYATNYNIVLCGERIYFTYFNLRPNVLEKCREVQLTKDMLDGSHLVTNTSIYMADDLYFKDGLFWKNQNKSGSSYYLEYVDGYNIVTLTMEASWAAFLCYLSDDYVYMVNEQIGTLVFALDN